MVSKPKDNSQEPGANKRDGKKLSGFGEMSLNTYLSFLERPKREVENSHFRYTVTLTKSTRIINRF